MSGTPNPSDTMSAAIRHVLLEDWDPHDAGRWPGATSVYDAYVEPLAHQVKNGATAEQLMDWLHAREGETMCFPSLGKERLRRVAMKLIALAKLEV